MGALAGLGTGFLVWCYTLLLPSFVRSGWVPESLIVAGPFGIAWLRPDQLFGVTSLGFWAHTVFWSLAANVAAFSLVSLYTRPSALESVKATPASAVHAGRKNVRPPASTGVGVKVKPPRVPSGRLR